MMLEKLKKFTPKNLASLIIFALIYFYLLYIFKPSLVFLNTTVTGGDTGSHNYVFYYLKKTFPSIHAWSHDWYYGFPFLYFYPPLLYVFGILLSYFIADNISFKLITLLGTFILPLTSYLCFRILNKNSIPEIAGILSLFFLFLEQYTIYGGNIPSTLAGEFSYSFSFSLFWLFIALMKKGTEENRHLILNTLLLSLMILSHPIPVMVSLVVMPFFLFLNFKKNLFYIIKVYVLAFIFTSWWSFPFLFYLDYSSPMVWKKFIRVSDIFPLSLVPLKIFALVSAVYGFLKRDKSIMLLLFIGVINLFFYLLLDNSKIWNTRFLPFFTMSCILMSTYFIGIILKNMKHNFFFLLLIVIGSILFINSKLKFIPFWIKWNYEGFERKQSWVEVKALFDYLKTLPFGRVMWEYTPEYGKFGTPRVLELIPMFSGKPTVEGLLIESALSAPFHFIIQAETTFTPTTPNFGFRYPSFNMKKAVEHMRFMGIRYFIAYTDEVKKEADKVLPKIGKVGNFAIYEIPQAKLIEPLFDFQVKSEKNNWKSQAIEWFIKDELSKPIIFSEKKIEKPKIKNIKCQLIKFAPDEITFYTEGVRIPHIVKVSYFPKWKVEGGEGPYFVSPSFMVVIPQREVVKIKWEY
uniref:Membrane protein 6-pyruvoyl-tetrahydropterin synthase-related domain-containing protein n=1 Tax=Thermodesulfobacterium geofontis TaxID=1295609 RepID=A0A7V5XFW9_9BACT